MKKIDFIVMNPAFDKDLHLKFLEKTIEISDNVVSVQPADCLFKNKYESIKKDISDVELISGDYFRKIFGIQSNKGGIFVFW